MTGQVATTAALTPAEIGTRVIAYVIDAILLGIVYLVLAAIIAVGDAAILATATRSVLFAIVSILYFGYGWTSWRASPGQRVLGMQTLNADGTPLNWNRAIVRWAWLFGPSALGSLFGNADQVGGALSFIVNLAVLGYYIYLLFTAANDPRRQGFHDKQADTLVVRAA